MTAPTPAPAPGEADRVAVAVLPRVRELAERLAADGQAGTADDLRRLAAALEHGDAGDRTGALTRVHALCGAGMGAPSERVPELTGPLWEATRAFRVEQRALFTSADLPPRRRERQFTSLRWWRAMTTGPEPDDARGERQR